MLQDNLEITNSIEIIGKVATEFVFSHEVYGEGFYSFEIEVPRLSDVSDLLPVTISERLMDRSLLPIGTNCKVSGQVRSYNNYVQSDRRNKLILTAFARDIEIIENEEEMNYLNPNEVFLNGFICKPTIFRKTPFGREISDMLLAVNRSYNKSDYIPCIAWGRNARFVSGLAVGDNVKLTGRMQSRKYQKKLENGEVLEKVAFEISISKIEYNTEDEIKEVETSQEQQ